MTLNPGWPCFGYLPGAGLRRSKDIVKEVPICHST